MIETLHPSAIQVKGGTFDRYSQLIDWGGSICYGRPMKNNEEQEQKFCKNLFKSGHMTPFEFVTIALSKIDHRALPSLLEVPHSHVRAKDGVFYWITNLRAMIEGCDQDGYLLDILVHTLENPQLSFLKESIEEKVGICLDRGGDTTPFNVRLGPLWDDDFLHKDKTTRPIVLFTCSRSMSHQLVRHRRASFLQESQRYCRYDDSLQVIMPLALCGLSSKSQNIWRDHMESCHRAYKELKNNGADSQTARGCLPGDTVTRVAMCASLKEWAWVFHLRCSPAADPEMRRIMVPLRERMVMEYPDILGYEEGYKNGGSDYGA